MIEVQVFLLGYCQSLLPHSAECALPAELKWESWGKYKETIGSPLRSLYDVADACREAFWSDDGISPHPERFPKLMEEM